ncbi:metal-dependent phosphohydrolase [Planctomycetales bacterium]|nr:metal-dependent phosphohydrolase [Planctomycetales bacterium]GHS97531.1 metal-dependent phosphohydrolase [Planctomycetales bacterium]GHT07080.1 metal-dependent phosphohydrolase [Planctomycetales bacterium]GHV22080.1 metal-dependent phosphohydrolase [Planctomycetales bacterium]
MSGDNYKDKVLLAVKDGSAVPPLSTVVQKLNALFCTPAVGVRDLAHVIETDTSLSAKILRQVNSPFYGLVSPVRTITDASVILGFNEIKHIANAHGLSALYRRRAPGGIPPETIWDHTLQIACLARAVAHFNEHPSPEQIFTAAILSKTGIIAFNNVLRGEYAAVVADRLLEADLPVLEHQRFAINHVHVGYILARLWKFPNDLLDAVSYQYNPTPKERGFQLEAAFIYAARRMLDALAKSDAPNAIVKYLPPVVAEKLRLKTETALNALQEAIAEYNEFKNMMMS